jgi:hypothetical protein
MTKFLMLFLILTSVPAFAVDCEALEKKVVELTAKMEKLDQKLATCTTDLQCREVFAQMNAVEALRKELVAELETSCR